MRESVRALQLGERLGAGVGSVYVVAGDDGNLVSLCVSVFVKQVGGEFSELNVAYLDGKGSGKLDAGCIIASLEGLPFGDGFKLVIIENFSPSKECKAQLKKYFENPNPLSVAVFVYGKDSGKDLKQALDGKYILVDCSKLDTNTLAKNEILKFERAGIALQSDAAIALVTYCANDSGRIQLEREKLILMFTSVGGLDCVSKQKETKGEVAKDKATKERVAKEKVEITVADIDNLVKKDLEFAIFEITNNIASGNKQLLIEQTRHLVQDNASPTSFLSLVYNYFRRLYIVKVSSATSAELAKALGIKEFAVRMLKQNASKFSEASIKQCMRVCAGAELDFKSGRIKEIYLESLFLHFVHLLHA
ncbi:MAG: hypothetical protein FWB72_03030 [Firmicutes bacterium]|nr:hypothetical protein [Bacillota bacterium]